MPNDNYTSNGWVKPRCNQRTGEVELPTIWNVLAHSILNEPESASEAAETLARLILEVDK